MLPNLELERILPLAVISSLGLGTLYLYYRVAAYLGGFLVLIGLLILTAAVVSLILGSRIQSLLLLGP